MKNILRKLHIVPGQPEDGDGSSSVSLSRSNGRSLTSWFNSAISRNSSPQMAGYASSSSSTVVADGRESSGSIKARGVEMDEEYQIQIALEMSLREDPEAAQIEAVKQISLSDSALDNTAAEVVAFRYWNYNALGYDDKISDGFYDLYGIFSESAMAKMPSLVDLQGTPVSDDISWEAVLVNRAEDSDLVELEQKALDMALELKSEFPDFGANGLIQSLANLVANYMGGATRDHFSMLKSWRNLSNSLRSRTGNIILPLGSLTIGLARHRALLFKLLADSLGIPCRLVKGKHYTGSDDGALNIVKLRDGREYIVDLMADPGTLIPSNVVALSKNYEETSSVNTGVSSSIGCYSQAEPLEQRCLSGNLDTSNSDDVTSDEMMNQKTQRLSSSPRASSENILDSFCKFTNIGSTKSQESSNVTDHPYKIGSSPSWTEGTSSPAVMMKVKDISQYMINATKGNPKLAQKLHDVLLESGVVAPPNLFTEISTELPQAASVVSMNVSKDKDETIKGEDGFKNKKNPDVTCGPFLPHLHLHKNVVPSRSQLDPLKPVDGMGLSYPLDSREEEGLNPLQFAKHMPVAAAAAATAAVVASSMVVAAAKSNADRNLDVPVTAAATATAVALVATTAVVESCLPVPIISQLGRDHGHDASLVMELDANEVHQERSSDKSTSNESGKSDVSLEDVAELEIPWDDIILGERIGLGSFGEVYRGDWHGTEVAVKKFLHQDISSDALEEFLSEVRIMRRLRHPNVVLLMGAVTRVPHLSIVTEFLHRGSLFRLIHRPNNQLDERRRLRMALDVARGMNYLHNCTPVIVHQDLKSPNLLVDKNWVVKVCDFGLSRMKLNTFLSSRSTAGTAEWMAPEVLRNEPSDEKADVFSFGVILWELCTLQQPWGGMNPMQVVGAVGFQHRRLDIPHDIDLVIADIINRCWNTDPKKRPSFSEIMAILKPLQKPVSSTQTTRERGS